jgi:hypothetical protein
VKGKSEKGGAGGASPIKSAMGADASGPDMNYGSSENRAPSFEGFVKSFMKQVVDMFAMAVMSGGMAAMMVAMKYYAMKAVADFSESMNSVGYADDP